MPQRLLLERANPMWVTTLVEPRGLGGFRWTKPGSVGSPGPLGTVKSPAIGLSHPPWSGLVTSAEGKGRDTPILPRLG